jgi:hypothetical protein
VIPVVWLAGAVVVALLLTWWVTRLGARVSRTHARVERGWAVLDAALVRRSERAAELACTGGVDPATTLLVCDAAAATLEPGLSRPEREQAESTLSFVLGLVALPGLERERERASLTRRLHNDAVTSARRLRHRPIVRALRLAGRAGEPTPFEMVDDELVWSGGDAR